MTASGARGETRGREPRSVAVGHDYLDNIGGAERVGPDKAMPEVSVIIPARNAAATLPATLRGLVAQQFDRPFEVILVDDGSSDETVALAQRSSVITRVLHSQGRGPAAARNAGAAAAESMRLAFLDADCRPTDGWLRAGSDALGQADLVLGETRPDPGQPLDPLDRTLWVTGPSPLYESANLFVRRDLFDRLKGFESWLGPRNGKELGEDVLFGWRAHRAGARIGFCAGALAHHTVFPRSVTGFVAERWRLRFFPPLARRVPELRTAFFYRRIFLWRRSALFDTAAAGLVFAALRRNPLGLLATIPYARTLRDDAREGEPPGGARVAGARLAADAVGAAAMAYGSVLSRSLLL